MKKNWIETKLEEVFEIVTGNTPSKKDDSNYGEDIPFVKPPELNNYPIIKASEFLSKKGALKGRVLPIGSVLITCIGNLGRVGINNYPVAFNQQINALKPNLFIESKFTFYQAQQSSFKNQLESLSTSTTVALVNKTNFSTIKFAIAPLPEQRAIVAKIEQLFSELDNGIANLKTAQEQLKVYRLSVLSSVMNSKKTVLISEIIDNLTQGWSPKCINRKSESPEEWSVIKTSAVQGGKFIEMENKILPTDLSPREQHEILKDDILITRAGPRVRVGICCLVRKTRPRLINCDKVYRIQVNKKLVMPEFFEYSMNAPEHLKLIEKMKTGSSDSGLNLTQTRFLNLEIPLPNLEEQHQIVQQIESRLSVCDKVEETIVVNLQKAEALRQSILKKAFSGELLTEAEIAACKMEKDWEPARELLKRIKNKN